MLKNKNEVTKQKLRKKYLKLLKTIDKKQKNQWDENIYQTFINSSYFKKYHVFALYYPLDYEIDVTKIILALLKNNKKVALPRIVDKNLEFYYIDDLLELVSDNEYNILQPKKTNKIANSNDLELIILPLVAFNQHYYRIGHGKGYYDYYLNNKNNIKALKLVLAYKIQEIPSNIIFADKWDIRFDCLITND